MPAGLSRRWVHRAFLCGLALLAVAGAHAQNFPTRPLRILVAQATGSTADLIARALAAQMQGSLGYPVAVENFTGGRAPLAERALIDNPYDAHVLMLVANATAIGVPLYQPKPDELARQVTPIALIGRVPMRLTAPTAAARSGLFASMPLAAAASSPGVDALVWFGLLAPANLHAGFRARLHAAVQHALASDDLQRALRSAGGEVWPGPPDAFAALLASERRRYESLSRDAHLQPD